MQEEASRTSVSAQRKGGTDPSAVFEEDRERGNAALRQLYGDKVSGEIEHFAEHASLVDLMLLYDVLKTWGLFAGPEDESVLAGAMAELFRDKPTARAPGQDAESAAEPIANSEDDTHVPRIIRQAQTRSEKRAAVFVLERCESAFKDWLHNANSAAEIALLTNVFGRAESEGDFVGLFLDHINLDRDKILGPQLPAELQADNLIGDLTKGRSAHA
jgi:hypothetical protein